MILIESIWQSVDDMIYINYKHTQRYTHTHTGSLKKAS